MIDIHQGSGTDSWTEGRCMTEAPWLHSSAVVHRTQLEAWTVVSERCRVSDSTLDDYTYLMQDVQVFNAAIGKFGNVASAVRINPTNHPMERASLHHFHVPHSLARPGPGRRSGRIRVAHEPPSHHRA